MSSTILIFKKLSYFSFIMLKVGIDLLRYYQCVVIGIVFANEEKG